MLDISAIENLSHEELVEAIKIQEEINRRDFYNKLPTYKPYQKQKDFHKQGAILLSERLLIAGNQLGKLNPADEPVLTPTGWVEIQHIKVGDEVIAGDGSVTEVIGVYPQGVKPIVELTFDYGEKSLCGGEHLWKCLRPKNRYKTKCQFLPTVNGKRKTIQVPNDTFEQWEVLKTQDIRAAYGDNPKPKFKHATPSVGVVKFPHKEVPINPYTLGVLLGDGCITEQVRISNPDQQIIDYVTKDMPNYGCELKKRKGIAYDVCTNAFNTKNNLKILLDDIGLLGKKSFEKFIPKEYLWNSPEVRLAILQGLMDTDGTAEKSGFMSYTSTSKQLAEDVMFLARSFGAKCKIKSRFTKFTHNGEKKTGKESFTVSIRLPGIAIFRLKRKLDRCFDPVSTTDHHLIESFRDVEPKESYCIAVAHPDHTYVTRDFIVTHNTVCGGAEFAFHLTGRYPDWWEGAVFNKPVVMWAAGVTNESTRDNPQRVLIGEAAQEDFWGSGWIPRECLERTPRGPLQVFKSAGIKHALDSAVIRWGGGGDMGAQYSTLYFKSYERGREKWQGPTLDGVWFDEEPPHDIYSEGRTRTQNGQRGIFTMITFTPLLGMSEVVRMFYDMGKEEKKEAPIPPKKVPREEPPVYEEKEEFDIEFDDYF